MGKSIKKYHGKKLPSLISDVLSVFGIPTNIANTLYEDALKKRQDEALEILLCEIRQGRFQNISQNDAVSIVARYTRDAMEGVAKNNLKIMAKIIKGMSERNQLKAPNFLNYANVLSSLTNEEIKVLAIMVKHKDNLDPETPIAGEHGFAYQDPLKDELKKEVPNYQAIQQALLRTGLVFFSVSAGAVENESLDLEKSFSAFPINSKVKYSLTPLMHEILRYIDSFDLDRDV